MNARTINGRSPNLLLAFLFAGGLINYMDRAVIGLLGPAIRDELGLSTGHFGIAMSAFSVGYTLFTLVGGWATDRYGSARVLLLTMLVWSIFAGMTGFAVGLGTLVLVRFLFGVAEAPWLSAFNKILMDRLPNERFSTFHSLCSSGQPLGGAIAGPVIGIVTATHGWRWGFLTVGLVGLLWVAVWLACGYSRERAFETTRNAIGEAGWTKDWPEAASHSTSRKDLMRNRTIWVTIFGMACATYLMVFFFNWFPSYLNDRFHLTKSGLGLASSLPWLVGVFAYVAGGITSDWLARRLGSLLQARRLMMTVCLLGSGLSTILVPFGPTLTHAIILMSVSMGLMFLTGSVYFAVGLTATPPRLVGFVSGIFLFCSNIAATVAPTLSGYLIDWAGSYASSFLVAGVLVMVAALTGFVALREPSSGGTRAPSFSRA